MKRKCRDERTVVQLLSQDLANERFVVNVTVISNLHALQEFVHFLVTQLLAQAGENVAQLTCTDVAISFLVKDLETADKFLCRTGNWFRYDLRSRTAFALHLPGVPAGLNPLGRCRIFKND